MQRPVHRRCLGPAGMIGCYKTALTPSPGCRQLLQGSPALLVSWLSNSQASCLRLRVFNCCRCRIVSAPTHCETHTLLPASCLQG